MRQISRAALIALTALSAGPTFAQTSTTTPVKLDAGGIVAAHYPIGDMWWDPAHSSYTGLEFPKGDTNQVRGFGGLLFGGIDVQGNLKLAGNIFRENGSDFQPGPIVAGTAAEKAASVAAWSKIWKVNSTTIDAFILSFQAGSTVIPAEILDWPGNGNTYARGANNTALTLNGNFAPFVDVDQDGIYNPYKGDYPQIKGSQMLWWLYNDATVHPFSATLPLNAEVAVSAYAYATGTIAANALFYEYDISNKGGTINNFHFGTMNDFDIDYAFNDELAIDSPGRLGVIFNGNRQEPASRNVAAGIVFCELPGDSYTNRQPLQTINGWLPAARNATAYYNLFTAPQIRRLGHATGDACEWSDNPGDRHLFLTTKSMTLTANSHARFAFAMVLADRAGYCPGAYLNGAVAAADSAYDRYWHPSRVSAPVTPTSVGTHPVVRNSIFPNPVTNMLHIESAAPVSEIRVTNTLGAAIALHYDITAHGAELQTASLIPGIYSILIRNTNGESTATTFVRQ
jgi:hypothetical protein